MRRTVLLLSAFFLLAGGQAAAQLSSFSAEPRTFLKELDNFVNAGKRSEVAASFKQLEQHVERGTFAPAQFEQIHASANAMLGRKLSATTYFFEYMELLNILAAHPQKEAVFAEFHQVYGNMLANFNSRRNNDLLTTLKFASTYYGSQALRSSDAGLWLVRQVRGARLSLEDEQLRLSFEEASIVGKRKEDSIQIVGTSGYYLPFEDMWSGTGGRVYWPGSSQGQGEGAVYCELSDYAFELKKNSYAVKEATLSYPQLFGTRKVKGSFEDRLIVLSPNATPSYPRFQSYDKVLEISSIGPGIRYRGGFRLEGLTVYGYGDKNNSATVEIANPRTQSLALRANAELFIIQREERIVAENAETTLFFDNDSIYHPAITLRYTIREGQMQLSRGERGSNRNPFFDSYHNVQIDADRLDWATSSDSLFIGKKMIGIGGGNPNEATFESADYYNEAVYRGLQNVSTVNPIATIMLVAQQAGTRELDALTIAQKMNPRYEVSSIESLLYDLVKRGFISYDADEQIVEVKDKVFLYADAARKKVDYDNIFIKSKTTETNAVIDMGDKSLSMNAVRSIEFSPRQRVAVVPFNESVRMEQDRNMGFDGKVYAGLGTFTGKDYFFDYGSFFFKMDSIRYFDLFAADGSEDENGNPNALSIGSRVEHLSGTLSIDAPSNKSGQEDIAIFPTFSSKRPGFVYYDMPEVQGGAYSRDSFFFALDNFTFNNLDRFMPADIQFKGTMNPAGIVPNFKETLRLQPDQSLGFVTKTKEGESLYGGQGAYKGQLGLSNAGFLGQGNVTYLNASVDSEDIIFKPKQMLASARRFDLEEKRGQGEVPQVRGADVLLDWKPYQDSMYVNTKSKDSPFYLFKEGAHTLSGQLILTPGGLRGNGTFDWKEATMESRMYLFGAYSVQADTCNLKIKVENVDENFAFDTRNVQGKIDFDKNIGAFSANSDDIGTNTMPYIQYQTSIGEFTWNMTDKLITFKAEPGQRSLFRSIHPEQDSLIFEGKTASYELSNNVLYVGGVPYIESADALIYTETGDVEIKANAVMTTLQNARIVANTQTKYHVINRATVNVKGRKDYTASGFYEYNVGSRQQEIEFSNIVGAPVGKGRRDQKPVATRASGKVVEADSFYMDLKTRFQGTIRLSSDSKDLTFEGYARFDAPKLPYTPWFAIFNQGDKNNLIIKYEQPKGLDEVPLRTGFYASRDVNIAYPSVMNALYQRTDRPILDTKGVFKYDRNSDSFIFGDSLKVVGNGSTGNKLVFGNATGKVNGEGRFDICSALRYCSFQSAGIISGGFALGPDPLDSTRIANVPDSIVEVEMLALLNFILPDKLMSIMLDDVKATLFEMDVLPLKADHVPNALAELIGNNKDYQKTLEGYVNFESIELPKRLSPTVFFNKLRMRWVPDYQSFVSRPGKLGIGTIAGTSVNRGIEAYLELKMPSNNDDAFYLYLKLPGGGFYFFAYKQGILSTVSSNTTYNDTLLALKKKETRLKMDDGEYYEIAPVNAGSAEFFVNRVKAAW